MDQHSKAELIKTYRKQYKKATKAEKTRIINAIIEATGYSRKHLIHALNNDVDIPKKVTRTRISRYEPIVEKLEKVWSLKVVPQQSPELSSSTR